MKYLLLLFPGHKIIIMARLHESESFILIIIYLLQYRPSSDQSYIEIDEIEDAASDQPYYEIASAADRDSLVYNDE